MLTRDIVYFGDNATVACDGNCQKAWGINNRPRIEFDPQDPDDHAFLADHELGDAPYDPGTYEGGHAKPRSQRECLLSKWCVRECERSWIVKGKFPDNGPPDFTKRLYNQPHKHPDAS